MNSIIKYIKNIKKMLSSDDIIIKQLLPKLSATLLELAAPIEAILHIQPTNEAGEREKFIAGVSLGKEYNPQFEYGPLSCNIESVRNNLDSLGLNALLAEYGTPIEPLISCTREINCALNLLEARAAKDFTKRAVEWHGLPTPELLAQANQILSNPFLKNLNKYTITAKAFRDLIEKRLQHYAVDHWNVQLVEVAAARVTVSPGRKQLRILESALFSEESAKRLFAHEIDTHILRSENGALQPYYPILSTGLDNYTETEEGLALLNEELTGTLDNTTLKNMALRVLAVSWSQEHSFYETHRRISKFIEPTQAYAITLRVKRGLANTSQPGGFTKDYLYLSGWRKLKKYKEEGGDIKKLYVGKISLNDIPTILTFISNGLIESPKYLPNHLLEGGIASQP